jgi:class 3 adenylate cyclase
VVATEKAARSVASEASDRWDADAYSLTVFCALVEMAILSGDAEGAEQFSRSLRKAWRRGVAFTTGWVFLVPRVLGANDAMQGRWDAAEEEFSRAQELAGESGALPELARVLLDNARMCMARGGAGDRERATELLLNAHDRFGKLGMRPFATQASALAEQLGFQMGGGTGASRVEDVADEPELFDASGRSQRFEERSFRIIFFTDMEESTSALERLGDFAARRIMRLHDRVLRAAVREQGGSEIQHTGDGLMVSFSSASNAIYCADHIHRDFERHSAEHPQDSIRVRIGVHGGEPLIQEDRLFGVAVNAAARLCNHAEPGTTLVSDVVRQLVAGQPFQFGDRGKEVLKGFSEPFRVFELI